MAPVRVDPDDDGPLAICIPEDDRARQSPFPLAHVEAPGEWSGGDLLDLRAGPVVRVVVDDDDLILVSGSALAIRGARSASTPARSGSGSTTETSSRPVTARDQSPRSVIRRPRPGGWAGADRARASAGESPDGGSGPGAAFSPRRPPPSPKRLKGTAFSAPAPRGRGPVDEADRPAPEIIQESEDRAQDPEGRDAVRDSPPQPRLPPPTKGGKKEDLEAGRMAARTGHGRRRRRGRGSPARRAPREKKERKGKPIPDNPNFRYIVRLAGSRPRRDPRHGARHHRRSRRRTPHRRGRLPPGGREPVRDDRQPPGDRRRRARARPRATSRPEFPPGWSITGSDPTTGETHHFFGADLDTARRDDVNRMKMIRSYRGVRHERGQKVRGQRTRSNGRTGMAAGVIKKAAKEAAAASGKDDSAAGAEAAARPPRPPHRPRPPAPAAARGAAAGGKAAAHPPARRRGSSMGDPKFLRRFYDTPEASLGSRPDGRGAEARHQVRAEEQARALEGAVDPPWIPPAGARAPGPRAGRRDARRTGSPTDSSAA